MQSESNTQNVSANFQFNIALIDDKETRTKKGNLFEMPGVRMWLQSLNPNSEHVESCTYLGSHFLLMYTQQHSLWTYWTGNRQPGTPIVMWHSDWYSFMQLTPFGKQMTTRHFGVGSSLLSRVSPKQRLLWTAPKVGMLEAHLKRAFAWLFIRKVSSNWDTC